MNNLNTSNNTNQTTNETTISVSELRNIEHTELFEVWDEEQRTWVNIEESPYIYDGPIGFSSVSDPYAPINSVALYHNWSNRMVVIAVPPTNYSKSLDPADILAEMNERSPLPTDSEFEVIICKNERELLLLLLDEITDSDVISGWNSEFFDVPYVGKRLEMLGKRYFNRLSFAGARSPRWRTVEVFKREQDTLDISGRGHTDYLQLFRKYEMDERPSYKLAVVADELLPDLPKLEYDGSLADLYANDFVWFMRYNLRDTEILKGFESVLGYVEVANQMYHLSTGLTSNVMGTLKLADLATINYCHHKFGGLIVPDNVVQEDDNGKIQGALVLLPQIGVHSNISSVDLGSLYPSNIMSIGISPENIVGQLEALQHEELSDAQRQAILDAGYTDMTKANEARKNKFEYAAELIAASSDIEIQLTMEDGTTVIAPAKQFRSAFKTKRWAISGYGTVFDQNKKGIIPMILADWYSMRKEYKRLMADAKNKMLTFDKDSDEWKELHQLATYYDKLQYVYKIKLNSFYGALTNKYFRFYDLRMGESTTGTGRKVLIHQCAEVCRQLNGEYIEPNKVTFEHKMKKGKEILKWHYGYTSEYAVTYGDTDSTYFLTYTDNSADAVMIGNEIGRLVNKSFKGFMQETFLCTDTYDDLMTCDREVVSDRGIFVDKKRYILHLVDLDGWACDKIKVMGLDTKKTTLPKEVSKKLNGFVERYLKGESWSDIATDIVDFKTMVETTNDIMSIGLPKGVNGIEDYTEKYEQFGNSQFLPGHVAAGIFYNICRNKFNDNESMEIMSGMKIKVFYLDRKFGKFKSIAIPVDIETIPKWFLENFNIDRQSHVQRLVDKPLNNIVKAIGEVAPSRQSLYVDSMLEF